MESSQIKLQGESSISRYLGFSSLSLVVLVMVGIALGGKISGIVVSIVVISFIIHHVRTKIIHTVTFKSNVIEVKYYLNTKPLMINYEQVRKMYHNNEPFIPTHVHVIVFDQNEKRRKVTFYCETKEFVNSVEPWLLDKGIKISERW